jgi:hypothetical protein
MARRTIATGAALALLAGCGPFAEGGPFGSPFGGPAEGPAATAARPSASADPAPGTAASAPPETAVTVEEFDTTSAEERAAAAAPPPRGAAEGGAAEETLGTTIASLGNPAAPGFWAETPLVAAPRPGRLTDPASGRSVRVELRPSGGEPGSGTRVSLPAFRVLGVPLTVLPELTVIGL